MEAEVVDYIQDDGNWDLLRLQGVLPPLILAKLQNLSPSSLNRGDDSIAWGLGSDGCFLVSSAYSFLVAQGALLTNAERFRRHISTIQDCPHCPDKAETIIHVLRDCPFAKLIWSHFVPLTSHHPFFQKDLLDWFDFNLQLDATPFSSPVWSLLFGITIDCLWRERNNLIFNSIYSSFDYVKQKILHLLSDTREAYGIGKVIPSCKVMSFDLYIKWIPPPVDWFKINTDGSALPFVHEAGCGGVLRDHSGRFIEAFAAFLGDCSIMFVELHALLLDVKLAIKLKIPRLVMESDSNSAIRFILHGYPRSHQCSLLVEEVINLASSIPGIIWSHTRREGNILANTFAKHALHYKILFQDFHFVPPFASLACNVDAAGVVFRRGCLN
ncbi:Ribonuclease H domain [Sesbania bispinosa]|nr:Ribonuclease H domain [Sesbania bispinosa]